MIIEHSERHPAIDQRESRVVNRTETALAVG
jgi:hypothetical protein